MLKSDFFKILYIDVSSTLDEGQMQNNPFGSLIEAHKNEFQYLNKNDRRMRFNNAKDPIYFAFNFVENRPVSALIKDFFEDMMFEIKKAFSPKKKK